MISSQKNSSPKAQPTERMDKKSALTMQSLTRVMALPNTATRCNKPLCLGILVAVLILIMTAIMVLSMKLRSIPEQKSFQHRRLGNGASQINACGKYLKEDHDIIKKGLKVIKKSKHFPNLTPFQIRLNGPKVPDSDHMKELHYVWHDKSGMMFRKANEIYVPVLLAAPIKRCVRTSDRELFVIDFRGQYFGFKFASGHNLTDWCNYTGLQSTRPAWLSPKVFHDNRKNKSDEPVDGAGALSSASAEELPIMRQVWINWFNGQAVVGTDWDAFNDKLAKSEQPLVRFMRAFNNVIRTHLFQVASSQKLTREKALLNLAQTEQPYEVIRKALDQADKEGNVNFLKLLIADIEDISKGLGKNKVYFHKIWRNQLLWKTLIQVYVKEAWERTLDGEDGKDTSFESIAMLLVHGIYTGNLEFIDQTLGYQAQAKPQTDPATTDPTTTDDEKNNEPIDSSEVPLSIHELLENVKTELKLEIVRKGAELYSASTSRLANLGFGKLTGRTIHEKVLEHLAKYSTNDDFNDVDTILELLHRSKDS